MSHVPTTVDNDGLTQEERMILCSLPGYDANEHTAFVTDFRAAAKDLKMPLLDFLVFIQKTTRMLSTGFLSY